LPPIRRNWVKMSRVRPEQQPCSRFGGGCAGPFLACAILVLSAGTALSQQAESLRGAVTEDEVNAYLLARPSRNPEDIGSVKPEDGSIVQVYEPVSEGAVPDEAEDTADNPFGNE